MKRFLSILILWVSFFISFSIPALADASFNITSANFDTSNSIISLTSTNITDLPDFNNIKLVSLSNPKRVYFDIPNSVLSAGKKDWNFSTPGIKEVKISQFSTNPNSVRVVIYYDDNFDISDINFLKIRNAVIIKMKGNVAQNPFMHNTYRDDRASANDFYEYTTVTTPLDPDAVIEQINNNFSINQKQILRLNTKYYVDKITPKNAAFTLNGFGTIGIEKPMVLSNPLRLVFDIPNTLVNPAIRNKEYSLGGADKVKIGQFSVNKARVVITSPDVSKYLPIYAEDNQSITFANIDKVDKTIIPSPSANLTNASFYKIDNQSGALTLNFDKPLVHAFDRTNSQVVVYLYNVKNFNAELLHKAIGQTFFSSSKLEQTAKGLKLSVPIVNDALVTAFTGADGLSLKLQIKQPAGYIEEIPNPISPVELNPVPSKNNEPATTKTKTSEGKIKIVIDPGHGGSDVGATRNNVHEKAITLDISKRVEKLLKAQGYDVKMTRVDDTFVSLADRVEISEEYCPAIFVSIHVNSSTSDGITGIETHYYHQESLPLAQTVHSSLASAINSPNRGLFKSKFYVINHTTSPAILIETGFISNTAERGQLVSESRKQATAKAIVEGINNYFK